MLLGPTFSPCALATEREASITILADHYEWSGIRINHLDALERLVEGLQPQVVRLEACGSAAERAQRAAAHRLQELNVELRWLSPYSQGCRGWLGMPVRPGTGGPSGIDDDVVDRWWHEQMP
jgi:hypothetical protein